MGDDFLAPPAALAHLLRRQVPRLPAAGRATSSARLGLYESVHVLALLLLEPPATAAASTGDVRGLGDGALRPAALRRVLPLLHGEGLGHPGLGDPVRVGGAADQGLLLLAGAARRCSTCSASDVDDADRGVPLPAARARGRCGRRCSERVEDARHPGAPQPPLHRRSATSTTSSRGITVESDGRRGRRRRSTPSSRAIPLSELILRLDPPPPDDVVAAARAPSLPRRSAWSRS